MVAMNNDPKSKAAELTEAARQCTWIKLKPNHASQLLRQALLLDADYAAAQLELAKTTQSAEHPQNIPRQAQQQLRLIYANASNL